MNEFQTKDMFLTKKGTMLTQSLFLEIGYSPLALYTLSEEDKVYKGNTYPSLKLLYMEYAYPGGLKGEYDFAMHCFYSWKQWLRICRNAQLKDHIDEWRTEREFKANSNAMRVLIDEIDIGGNASVSTSKYLLDRGYVEKNRKGRPSKAEKERRIKQDAQIHDEYSEDFDRMKDLLN